VHKPGNHISRDSYSLLKFSGIGGFFLVVLALLACVTPSQSTLTQADAAIFQKWQHSYEEDTKDLKIYRPSSFDFPRGWGRTGMRIEKNGEFILYDIAPNDAIVQVPGRWSQTQDGKLEISFPSGEKEDYTIEIQEINTEILKIRK
jgi:hypothetical protein